MVLDIESATETRELWAAVRQALRRTGHRCLSQIEVEFADDALVIRGQVPTYFLKQLAQTAVLSVVDVLGFKNEVIVTRHAGEADFGTQAR